MRILIVLTFFLFTVFTGTAKVKIIFDTDFGGDADDLGALAMLHNLHNKGECELLGMEIPEFPWESGRKIHIFRTGITIKPLPMHCHIN